MKWCSSICTVFADESVTMLCVDRRKIPNRAGCHHHEIFCSKPKCSILYLRVSQKKKIVRANPYCFSFKTNWKWMQLRFNVVLASMPIKKTQMKFWTFILAFLLRLFCSPSKPWVCCEIHLPSLILNVSTLIQANSCMCIQSWCHLWTSNLAYCFNNLFFSAWQM